jgi:hypothetical protein
MKQPAQRRFKSLSQAPPGHRHLSFRSRIIRVDPFILLDPCVPAPNLPIHGRLSQVYYEMIVLGVTRTGSGIGLL